MNWTRWRWRRLHSLPRVTVLPDLPVATSVWLDGRLGKRETKMSTSTRLGTPAANLSKSCKAALAWLKKHNSTGCFEKWPRHHVLLAAGEEAPFMYGTWLKLQAVGLVQVKNRRVTVVESKP